MSQHRSALGRWCLECIVAGKRFCQGDTNHVAFLGAIDEFNAWKFMALVNS